MLSSYFTLLKIDFLSFLGLNKVLHEKKNKRISGLSGMLLCILVIGGAFCFFGYTYADMFGAILTSQEKLEELIATMVALSGIIGFFFSFYAVGNVLYSNKQYDLLASYPVSSNTVVFAKISYIYLSDLIYALLMTVPSFFVYSKYGGSINAGFIIRCAILIISSPLFAVVMSVIVGTAVSAFSTFFKKKSIAQTVVIFLFIIGIMVLNAVDASGNSTLSAINKIYFIYPVLREGVLDYRFAFLTFALCFMLFTFTTIMVGATFKSMHALLLKQRKVKNFKLKTYKEKGVTKTLLGKELKRLFSCPIYCINTMIGSVLSVGISVVLAIVMKDLTKELGDVSGILLFAPAFFAFMCMLTPTTYVSISLEGETFYILRTAPVKLTKIFDVKLLVNIITETVPAFVSAVIICIGFRANVITALLLCANAILISMLGGSLGLLYNILFPTFKWEHENKPVKQSLSGFLAILTAFVFAIGFGLIACFVNIDIMLLLTLFMGILLPLNIVIYFIIVERGEGLLFRKE